MCTAIYYSERFLGRNLDLCHRYRESVTLMPNEFRLKFRYLGENSRHNAVLGMATVVDGYPLYYDGFNQHGLGVCALNFVGYCKYTAPKPTGINLASFELIPYLLCNIKSVAEVRSLIPDISLTSEPFSDKYPAAELHYIVADKRECIVLEPREDGIIIYDNPIGVLTNNPPFDYHRESLRCYLNLTADAVENRFTDRLRLSPFSGGTGTMGLPGDSSSPSRFIRAAFNLLNSPEAKSEADGVCQALHILDSAAKTKGCERSDAGLDMTQYSSIMDLGGGVYYYKTYNRFRISAIKLKINDIKSDSLVSYKMRTDDDILVENP